MSGTGETKNRKAAAMPRSQSRAKAPSSAMPARILVVEDQDSIREFMRRILTGAGHEVAVAINGVEAVAAVRDAGFDLILMDVYMPVMNGLTATRKIRALEGPPSRIPIIGISGDVGFQVVAGMNDHICKPFRKAELLLKVDTWLKGEFTQPALVDPPDKSGATAFEEAYELMGRPWALRGLARLTVQIDEAFGTDLDAARSDGRLVGQAHALVSLAAVLGFSTLSELCSTLEEACKSGHGVRLPFEYARAAASEARKTAIDLIADLQVEDS